MTAIQLDNISKYYGSTCVFDDFSLSIESGTVTALLGPSGCGKTTLLRVIAGLESLYAGTVSLNGTVVTKGRRILLPARKRKLSMVFQDLALWPHLTVEKHLKLALSSRKMSRSDRAKAIQSILERLDIVAHRKKYPSAMSGGEQQRLALARALCVDPDIILLDEPLSHLDADLKESMLTLLQELISERKITTVYVTHDRSEVARFDATVVELGRTK